MLIAQNKQSVSNGNTAALPNVPTRRRLFGSPFFFSLKPPSFLLFFYFISNQRPSFFLPSLSLSPSLSVNQPSALHLPVRALSPKKERLALVLSFVEASPFSRSLFHPPLSLHGQLAS
jgi:hypothetical protein